MHNLKFLLRKDKFLYGKNRKTNTKFFLSSIISILIALIVALLVATMMGYNPGTLFVKLFSNGFKSPQMLFHYLGIFALSAFAFSITFKTGIFNIGISGQMLAAGTSIIFLIKLLNHFDVADKIPNGAGQVIIVLLAMIVGSLIALIIGSLDVFLKVNCVVSSILLNWIIYFTCFYLLATFAPQTANGILVGSEPIPENFLLIEKTTGTGGIIPISIIVAIISIFIFVIFKYTVFGHKIKAIGLSNNGSVFAGYKVKKIKLLTFIISGSIAGILACVLYTTNSARCIPININTDAIPSEGFDGIAISLIACNNPFSIIIIALIFGLFKQSLVSITIPPSYFNVLIGLIMIGATLSIVIIRWKPWCYLNKFKYNKYFYNIQSNFDNQFNELISKYLSILKWEQQKIYNQNISKSDKKRLWKETMIEIQEDYLTEKDKVMDNFEYEKLRLYIENKLNIMGNFNNKKTEVKNYHNLAITKKCSKYSEKIKLIQMELNREYNNKKLSQHEQEHLMQKIAHYQEKIINLKNINQEKISADVDQLSIQEFKKLTNDKKIKNQLHKINLKIAEVKNSSWQQYFSEIVYKYLYDQEIFKDMINRYLNEGSRGIQ